MHRLPFLLLVLFLLAGVVRADNETGDAGDAGDTPEVTDDRPVWERLQDPRSRVRVAAMRELEAAGDAIVPELIKRLEDPASRVRRAATLLLVKLAPDTAFEPLVARLEDDSPTVAAAARKGLLELFEPGRVDRLEELADRIRAETGGIDEGFDRLLYVYRLREILAVLGKWRTDRSSTGIRFVGQYQGALDEFPDGIDILLRFIDDDTLRSEELDWPLGEAQVAAVRALGDNNILDARAPLQRMLQRTGLMGNRFYIRRQGVAYGEGDIQALQQVIALTLYRLGVDLNVEDQLVRYERSLRDYPNPWMAFMMACIYQEFGDLRRCEWALQITIRSNDQPGWANGNAWLSLSHLHLAAMTLARLEADEPADDAEDDEFTHEDAEPPSIDLAMRHLKLSLELGFNDPQWLRIDPRFDAVRDNPTFQRHLRNLERIYPPIDKAK